MKRLLVCTAFAMFAASLAAVAPARAADRGQPLLDNVPSVEQGLVPSPTLTAKLAVNESQFASNGIDLMAVNVDISIHACDVGLQPNFSNTFDQTTASTNHATRPWGSSTASTRCGAFEGSCYLVMGDRLNGDFNPALRPDPHNGIGSQHTLA